MRCTCPVSVLLWLQLVHCKKMSKKSWHVYTMKASAGVKNVTRLCSCLSLFACRSGQVVDRRGKVIECYPEVPAMLHYLYHQQVLLGVASRFDSFITQCHLNIHKHIPLSAQSSCCSLSGLAMIGRLVNVDSCWVQLTFVKQHF